MALRPEPPRHKCAERVQTLSLQSCTTDKLGGCPDVHRVPAASRTLSRSRQLEAAGASPAWLALMQALSFAREESHARELAAQRPAVAASHLLNACRSSAHGSAAAATLAGRSVALSASVVRTRGGREAEARDGLPSSGRPGAVLAREGRKRTFLRYTLTKDAAHIE